MDNADAFDVGGRRLTIRNLDRVLFPQTTTTKAEVLRYYASVAPVMLPHLQDRLLHMHRYPEGVEGPRFWQKACPEHRPDWLPTAPVWSRDKRAYIEYCVVNEPAALLWAVNLGSIELHSSLHRRVRLHRPTVLAFDLDPGPGATILDCCEVAIRLRKLLCSLRLASYPKTSGSKGLQLYVPLNAEVSYEQTKPVARRIAELLEQQTPGAVVSRMAKAARIGKVLIDWSQNTEHKSMVCVYSLRAKATPTVSTPVSWHEVEAALDAGEPRRLSFEMAHVLERVAQHGDLFEPVLSRRQDLVGQLRGSASALGQAVGATD
jgi:bifunctional non-homologous end joining protein LigD